MTRYDMMRVGSKDDGVKLHRSRCTYLSEKENEEEEGRTSRHLAHDTP